MNNKLILTSLLAISVASPAMAALPTYMTKGQTYAGEATLANMGTSTSSTPANAAAYYSIDPGYYLPTNQYNVVSCPANSYCPGVSEATKGTNPQGQYSCSSATGSAYPYSAAGSNSMADCYKGCVSSDSSVSHMSGTTVTGNIYYGNLSNCEPSACATGYTKANIAAITTFGDRSGTYDSTDSSVWKLSYSNGDWLKGGYARKVDSTGKGFYTLEEISAMSSVPATSTADSSVCFCWINEASTTISNHRRNVSMSGLAVRACTGSTCSNDSACAQACANAVEDSTKKELLLEHASNTNKCIPSMYNVTYNCGTGTGTVPSAHEVTYGSTYTPRSNGTSNCKKTGYSFAGWGVSGTSPTAVVQTNTSPTWDYTEDKTFTATWTANTITININNNNGSGTCSSVSCKYDSACTAPSWNSSTCNLTKSGKVLKGWNTSPDGTGTNYAFGASIKNIIASGSTTLYAVWETAQCQSGGTGVSGVTLANPSVSNNKTQCEVACNAGYSKNGGTGSSAATIFEGTAGVGTYKPNCQKNSVFSVSLDSKKYTSASDTEGASAATAGAPTPVYLWYGKGWYKDSATTTAISSLTTKPLFYAEEGTIFTGFYTNKSSAVSGTSSARVVNAAGAFDNTKNTVFESNNSVLVAGYTACTCTKGTKVKSCTTMGIDSSTNQCMYSYTCDSGYHVGDSGTTASGTFKGDANIASNTSPNCSANTISLSWANGGRGTTPSSPASCTYDGTFTMPAALTATGYTFKKWNVNSKEFNGGQSSVACTYANLGKYSGTATITASWQANTISIIWNGIASNASLPSGGGTLDWSHTGDGTGKDGADTARSSVTYDGNIYTPDATVSKTGQSFLGWRFSN